MIFLFAVCFAATALGAVSGIGGGVIIKPVMDAGSGLNVTAVSFLSGCTVLSMALVSLFKSRKDNIKLETGISTALAFGAAGGGLVGKGLFENIKGMILNDYLIGGIQNFLLALLTLGVLVYILSKEKIRTYQVKNLGACFGIGFLLGGISAFLGIGGGPVNLIVLYFFFSMDTKKGALNSIYIIFFSQTVSLLSTIGRGEIPVFENKILTGMIFGGILGGTLGRRLSKRLTEKQTETLFLCIVVCIEGISLYNLYRFSLYL